MFRIFNPSVAGALRTLNGVNTDLQRAISQAASGKAVATVADNPAAYVNAIRLTSDAQAFIAVKTGLAGAEVPTRVASAAIDGITAALMKVKDTAIGAQSGGVSGAAASVQIQALVSQVSSYESDAAVNGVNLVAGAVVNGVKLTQIRVPRDLSGNNITIGDMGLSQMNASAPGLGLANFTGTQDGLSIDFSSLSVENITTSAPATQVQLHTANYGNGESPQYPGQSWTFVFTNAPGSNAGTDTNSVSDAEGNVIHVDHTIPVPLPVGFSRDDAVTAMQNALFTAKFESQFTPTGPTLSIAGNNVGTVTPPVQNLQPSHPIPIAVALGTMTAAVNPLVTPLRVTINTPVPLHGLSLSSVVGPRFCQVKRKSMLTITAIPLRRPSISCL
jgi:flagellin-like hook-associated protein FlgL